MNGIIFLVIAILIIFISAYVGVILKCNEELSINAKRCLYIAKVFMYVVAGLLLDLFCFPK